jgi:hypothetical protein
MKPMVWKRWTVLNMISSNVYFDPGRTDSVIGSGSYLAAYDLAVFNEVSSETERSVQFNQEAGRYEYQRALNRLRLILGKSE